MESKQFKYPSFPKDNPQHNYIEDYTKFLTKSGSAGKIKPPEWIGILAQESDNSPLKLKSSSSRQPIDLSGSKLSQLDNPGAFAAQPKIGKRKLKAIRKKARDQTKGPQWFDMTAPEITDDRKNDLEALKLRSVLDTKTFYKRNTVLTKPKHFQIGRVVESHAEFYNSRLTKKQRKRTLAEELMGEMI